MDNLPAVVSMNYLLSGEYRTGFGGIMLDFQEELEKFKPSREVGDMEDVIIGNDAVDITDILLEMIKEDKK